MILVLIDFDGVIVDTKKKSKIIFTKCLRKIKRCKDNNLINYLYKKVDGLDILAISKYLGNYFKNDYLFFYKFLTTEWENVYKKTVLKKENRCTHRIKGSCWHISPWECGQTEY